MSLGFTVRILVQSFFAGAAVFGVVSAAQIPEKQATPEKRMGEKQVPEKKGFSFPGSRLDSPTLQPGESLGTIDLRAIVEDRTKKLEKALYTPSNFTFTDASPDITREMILRRIPIGFGTLKSTKDVRNPGPKVGAQDERVIALKAQPLIERIIGRSNLLPVRFLESGVIVSRPVARVAIKFSPLPEAGVGTGFMASRTLFITNNHVIGDKGFAKKLDLQFNYQYGLDGATLLPHTTYEFDPDSFFFTDADLDFTVVRVKPRSVIPTAAGATTTSVTAGVEHGYLQLGTSFFYSEGQLASVIQHPQGKPKEIALHENEVVSIHQDVIRYTTDTEPGSSGSPVFNNSWQVIALHHSAGEQDAKTEKWLNNEGIRIDKIIARMKATFDAAVIQELGI